jgi:hypothetical protein
MTGRRLLILKAISLRLQDITVANGYNTDAGKLVLLGHSGAKLGPNDPDVAVAIVPGAEEVIHQMENVEALLPIGIHALAKADLQDPGMSIEELVDDIQQAIELEDRRLGGLITVDLKYQTTESLEREEGSTTVGASVEYAVQFKRGWGNS